MANVMEHYQIFFREENKPEPNPWRFIYTLNALKDLSNVHKTLIYFCGERLTFLKIYILVPPMKI